MNLIINVLALQLDKEQVVNGCVIIVLRCGALLIIIFMMGFVNIKKILVV